MLWGGWVIHVPCQPTVSILQGIFSPYYLMGRWRTGMRHAWLGCSSKQFFFQSSASTGRLQYVNVPGLQRKSFALKSAPSAWCCWLFLGQPQLCLLSSPICFSSTGQLSEEDKGWMMLLLEMRCFFPLHGDKSGWGDAQMPPYCPLEAPGMFV